MTRKDRKKRVMLVTAKDANRRESAYLATDTFVDSQNTSFICLDLQNSVKYFLQILQERFTEGQAKPSMSAIDEHIRLTLTLPAGSATNPPDAGTRGCGRAGDSVWGEKVEIFKAVGSLSIVSFFL